MELHTLKPFKNARKYKKRIGRGLGTGHGAYSTRGIKGQRSRSGGKKGLKARGLKMFLLRIPKKRGFKSIHKKAIGVNIEVLEKHFSSGANVTPEALATARIVRQKQMHGKALTPKIKILGQGKMSKKLTVSGMLISEAARKKIEAAGGSVAPLTPRA